MSENQAENGTQYAKIRPNQRKAIEALITGATMEIAALEAGVTLRTVYVWRTQDNFKQALNEAQNEALSSAVIALSGATVEAVQVLRDIASDEKQKASTRVQAARAILDSAIRLKELHDLENRVQELEKRNAS